MMSDSLPLVSIITPVYNGSKYLEKLIKSVADQDYARIEHIVIDDGSTDDGKTTAMLKGHPQVRWWSRDRVGQYATMNEGLMAARGDLVCFINADDVLAPGAVARATSFLQSHPDLDGAYGTFVWIDEDDSPHRAQAVIHHAPLGLFRYLSFITHCSLYLRRDRLLQEEMFFDSGLQFVGDYEWIIRMIDRGFKFGFIRGELSLVRYHPEQSSNQFASQVAAERALVFRRLGVQPSMHRFASAATYWISAFQRLVRTFIRSGPMAAFQLLLDWYERRKR